MELRRLSYFMRIAEDGSLTRAAGVLRIAQPALSRQVRLLEEELGVTLFSRTARGMQLTEEGEYLRAALAGPLRALELALQNTRSFSTRIEGNIVLGITPGIGDVLARQLLVRMDARLPDIKLRVVEGVAGSLFDWLNRGIVDFALHEEASRDDRLTDRKLYSERLVLIGGQGSDLDPDRAIAFKDAVDHPLVVPSHHLGVRAAITEAAAKLRLTLNIRFEVDSPRLIKELVADGMGYAILPASHVLQDHRQGRLRLCPVTEPELTQITYLSTRAHSLAATGKIEGALIETVMGLVAEIGEATASPPLRISPA